MVARAESGYNPSIVDPITRQPRQSAPHVPFVDLTASNRRVKARILERISATIDRGDFVEGDAVGDFERAFGSFVGRRHCVGVSSGVDALRLSLVASELVDGAGVIVPALTFAATFEAVLQAGGRPVV